MVPRKIKKKKKGKDRKRAVPVDVRDCWATVWRHQPNVRPVRIFLGFLLSYDFLLQFCVYTFSPALTTFDVLNTSTTTTTTKIASAYDNAILQPSWEVVIVIHALNSSLLLVCFSFGGWMA